MLVTSVIVLLGFFGVATLPGKVVSVQDGDTITIFSGASGFRKIRVYGIDCPESRQKGGMEATAFTQKILFLENVTLTVVDKDLYGREVAIVHLPSGKTLNEELVTNGHAWVYSAYCKITQCAKWKYQEQKAKKKRVGLWAAKNPTAPWRWRKMNPRQ